MMGMIYKIGLGTAEICILQYIAIFPMNIVIHIATFLFEFFMKQKHHSVKPEDIFYCALKMFPAVVKALSDGTLVAGIHSIHFAN